MKLYLISTDSKILLDEKLQKLITNSNRINYRYKECSVTDILEEASYVSFFQEEKFVVVKNADFFGKEKLSDKDSEALLKYFENPYPYTTIIFVTYEDVDMRKSITKKIGEVGEIISLKAPKNYDLFTVIKKEMQLYRAEDAVVKYIIEACISNYDFIINEVEKLRLYYKPNDKVTLEEIKKIIVTNVNDNVFKFVDAVIQKDAYTVFHLLEDFQSIKIDVFQLINLLAREYRLIYYYKILEQKNYGKLDMVKELKLQDWQVDKVRREASQYHKDDIKDFLINISHMDRKIKSGLVEKNTAFTTFLISVLEY